MHVKPNRERYSVIVRQKASNSLKSGIVSDLYVRALTFLREFLKTDAKTSKYV